MRKIHLVLFVLFAWTSFFLNAEIVRAKFHKNLIKAAISLKKDTTNLKALKTLRSAVFITKDQSLKKVLVDVVALSLHRFDNKSFYASFSDKLQKKFPTENLLSISSSSELSVICKTCGGTGEYKKKCTRCNGSGKCPNSKCNNGKITYMGMDKKTYVRTCPICNGTGKCPECNGRGFLSLICKKCIGGRIIIPKKIDEILSKKITRVIQITAIINEEQEEAAAEKN